MEGFDITRIIPLTAALTLAACGLTPAQQTAVTTATLTLAQIAATKNTTAAAMLAEGALVCGKIDSATGRLIADSVEVIANAAGLPVSVIGQLQNDVASACPAGLVPGPMPSGAAPASVPVVATGSSLPVVVPVQSS